MTNPDTRLPNRVADPTHTTTLRSQYQGKLRGLFTQFKGKITPSLNRMDIRPGAVDDLGREIDDYLESTIHAGAPNVIRKNITLSYEGGKRAANRNPRIQRSRLTIPYEINYLDQQVIDDLRMRNFSLVKSASGDMKANMLRVMSDGIRQQQSTQTIARNMTKEITSIGRKRSQLIAQTEISYSYNNAIAKSYEQAGIEKWQWLATMSDRTCEICEGKHGEIFRWGDMQPPEHPRCLCTIYPIIDKKFER